MIGRDRRRLGLNLLLGPPVAYLVGLGAACVGLLAVSEPDHDPSLGPAGQH